MTAAAIVTILGLAGVLRCGVAAYAVAGTSHAAASGSGRTLSLEPLGAPISRDTPVTGNATPVTLMIENPAPPTIFDPDDHIRYLRDLDRALTVDDVERACARCGRNDLPWVTYCALSMARYRMARDVAGRVVPIAWSATAFPQQLLTRDWWW
jgi:hypothetical protein